MIHSFQFVLVAAGIGDWIGSLIGLAVLVLWVIRQIVEANQQAAPPREAPPAEPQPAKAGAPAAAGKQADPLRNQVEEFLRRAGRQPQAGQPQRRPQPVASEIELLVDDATPLPERPPLGEPLRPLTPAVTSAPAKAAEPVPTRPDKPRPTGRPAAPRRRQSVAEHVAEQVTARSRNLARHTSSLGRRIIEEDQQFDVKLKAKFDHSVGSLAGSVNPVAEPERVTVETPASQIAAMLANPDGVRQAIVVNEILRRPSDRW